jgi:hypothetical protein
MDGFLRDEEGDAAFGFSSQRSQEDQGVDKLRLVPKSAVWP